jgi:hypothetical protein
MQRGACCCAPHTGIEPHLTAIGRAAIARGPEIDDAQVGHPLARSRWNVMYHAPPGRPESPDEAGEDRPPGSPPMMLPAIGATQFLMIACKARTPPWNTARIALQVTLRMPGSAQLLLQGLA